MHLVRVRYAKNCIFICNILKKTYQCRIYTETLSPVKDTNSVKDLKIRAVTPGPAPCNVKKFQSSCGRARVMIILL